MGLKRILCVSKQLLAANRIGLAPFCIRSFSTSGSLFRHGHFVGLNDETEDEYPYSSPMELYEYQVSRGELKRDAYQQSIIEDLQKLHDKLLDYTPKKDEPPGLLSRWFGGSKKEDETKKKRRSPQGLYLYGSVGCGKTMLMDLFHSTCHIPKKQRIHFHAFMLDVHKRIHIYKESVPRQYNMSKTQAYDPIPPVARSIAEESWLLCFDEFQVTDIADAMILKRLFSHLWRNGVVVIATSNRPPDDLYKNGLQRINFLPFIPMMKEYCKVKCLDSGIDYRRMTMPAEGKVYFVMSECNSEFELDNIFYSFASSQFKEVESRVLTVLGRKVKLPKTCGRVLDITFQELCMKPLGAADYLAISKEFDVVILRGIPTMDLERKTEARRFITLIDTLYDNKVRFVCSAEAPHDDLFATATRNISDGDKHFHRVLIGDLDISVGSENETASIFTGEEELFAFERVRSRLTEMQTEEYWAARDLHLVKKEKEEKRKAKVSVEGDKRKSAKSR